MTGFRLRLRSGCVDRRSQAEPVVAPRPPLRSLRPTSRVASLLVVAPLSSRPRDTTPLQVRMPTPPLDRFADLYTSGRLLFFAGSGISLASGLPSAEQVLRHTVSAALPSIRTATDQLVRLQPEVFYETLLTFSNTEKVLSLWTALHPRVLADYGQYPKGNIVHRALVKYSARFGIPILTTNFDTLFESAAEQEGMKPPPVYLPTQETPDAFPSNTAMICKLHGTIEANGNPDVSSLYSTMTQIAKVNDPWIKYITTLMKEFHICFVGYSGRDLDIFPLIEAASHESETKTPIWINKQFSGDPSCTNFQRCNKRLCHLEVSFPPNCWLGFYLATLNYRPLWWIPILLSARETLNEGPHLIFLPNRSNSCTRSSYKSSGSTRADACHYHRDKYCFTPTLCHISLLSS